MNIEDKIEDLSYMTGVLNTMARSGALDLCYTNHCTERMKERNITVSDIRFVLKCGIIESYLGPAEFEGSNKIHKYKITGDYLGDDTGDREISLIILVEIDRFKNPAIKVQKIITAMWRD